MPKPEDDGRTLAEILQEALDKAPSPKEPTDEDNPFFGFVDDRDDQVFEEPGEDLAHFDETSEDEYGAYAGSRAEKIDDTFFGALGLVMVSPFFAAIGVLIYDAFRFLRVGKWKTTQLADIYPDINTFVSDEWLGVQRIVYWIGNEASLALLLFGAFCLCMWIAASLGD